MLNYFLNSCNVYVEIPVILILPEIVLKWKLVKKSGRKAKGIVIRLKPLMVLDIFPGGGVGLGVGWKAGLSSDQTKKMLKMSSWQNILD